MQVLNSLFQRALPDFSRQAQEVNVAYSKIADPIHIYRGI